MTVNFMLTSACVESKLVIWISFSCFQKTINLKIRITLFLVGNNRAENVEKLKKNGKHVL